MKFASFLAVAAVCLLSVGTVFASPMPVDGDYNLQYGTDAFQTSFSAQVGQTVDIDVYLYEFLNQSTYLYDDYDGLSGVGVKLQRLVPLTHDITEPAYVSDVSDIAPNGSFDEPNPSFSPIKFVNFDGNNKFVDAGLNEYIYYASPTVQASSYDATTKRVYIGTFTFTAGMIVGETTDYLITDFDALSVNTVTGSPEVGIDDIIADFSFSITAIPEPASLAILAIGSIAAIRRKRS